MTKEQEKIIQEFEDYFGFAFMYKDDITSDPMSFISAWDSNIDWLKDWIEEGQPIIHEYRNKHFR